MYLLMLFTQKLCFECYKNIDVEMSFSCCHCMNWLFLKYGDHNVSYVDSCVYLHVKQCGLSDGAEEKRSITTLIKNQHTVCSSQVQVCKSKNS